MRKSREEMRDEPALYIMDDRVTNRRYPPCIPAVAAEDTALSILELLQDQSSFEGINNTNVSVDVDKV